MKNIWRSLRWPEKATIGVAALTFVFLFYVCGIVLLAGYGAPLGRLSVILALWFLKVETLVSLGTWIAAHLAGAVYDSVATLRGGTLSGVAGGKRRIVLSRASMQPGLRRAQ